jgi:tetratricopeptide (TPR) repeat protein
VKPTDNEMAARIYVNYGIACERAGQILKACDCYRHAMVIAPSSFTAHKVYGSALLGLGQLNEAVDLLTRALSLSGQRDSDAHCDLGVALVCCPGEVLLRDMSFHAELTSLF